MAWPSANDYREAIRTPGRCFDIEGLAQGQVITGPDGIPLMYSGESACVFQMAASGSMVAIRCFTAQVKDFQERYDALDEHISGLYPDPLTEFQYVEEGIKVGGEWYPAVIMDWAEGKTLDKFIESNLDRPDILSGLAGEWQKLDKVLRTLRIAHNNLEHGNIIVTADGEPRLVDYDGVFLSKFQGEESPVPGHRHYQHPTRSARHYNEESDSFPSLVIYLSLIALAANPALWDQFHTTDNLILTRQDLSNPGRSKCLQALSESPDPAVVALAGRLASFVLKPVGDVPSLESLLKDIPAPAQYEPPEVDQPSAVQAAGAPATQTQPSVGNLESQPAARDSLAVSTAQANTPLAPPMSAGPAEVAQASIAGSAEAAYSGNFLMSGRLLLGMILATFASILLTGIVEAFQHVAVGMITLTICLLPFQARFRAWLPVVGLAAVGAAIYYFSVIQNGTFTEPFDPTRDTTVENMAAVFYGIALALLSFGLATRLLGITRVPEPATGLMKFIEGLGKYNRTGMVLPAIGIPLFVIGLAPQELIDSFFYQPHGTEYHRGQSLAPDASALYWPLMILDKVEYVGKFCFVAGIILLLLGAPRRILFDLMLRFAYMMKGSSERSEAIQNLTSTSTSIRQKVSSIRPGSSGDETDAVECVQLIQFGLKLFTFGILGLLLLGHVLEGFLIPTGAEIADIFVKDLDLFYFSWEDYPGWLTASVAVIRFVSVIVGGAGALIIVVGTIELIRQTRAAKAVGGALDKYLASSGSGRAGSAPTSSTGGGPEISTGHNGMLAAIAAAKGGKGG